MGGNCNMTKVEYFKLEESAARPGKYTICMDFEKLPPMRTNGSYNILFARLMNLSYAQYLRFCRDMIGAEISGKNTVYPVAYFSKTINTVAFVRLLNSRMNLVMWEREHPNWREHQEYLKQKEKEKQVRKEAWINNVSNS
jgi:hypothetical protein